MLCCTPILTCASYSSPKTTHYPSLKMLKSIKTRCAAFQSLCSVMLLLRVPQLVLRMGHELSWRCGTCTHRKLRMWLWQKTPDAAGSTPSVFSFSPLPSAEQAWFSERKESKMGQWWKEMLSEWFVEENRMELWSLCKHLCSGICYIFLFFFFFLEYQNAFTWEFFDC